MREHMIGALKFIIFLILIFFLLVCGALIFAGTEAAFARSICDVDTGECYYQTTYPPPGEYTQEERFLDAQARATRELRDLADWNKLGRSDPIAQGFFEENAAIMEEINNATAQSEEE